MNDKEKEIRQINKDALGKMADFCMDLAKLVFAGIIIAGIIDLSADKVMLVWSGSLVVVLLLISWYLLFIRSRRRI